MGSQAACDNAQMPHTAKSQCGAFVNSSLSPTEISLRGRWAQSAGALRQQPSQKSLRVRGFFLPEFHFIGGRTVHSGKLDLIPPQIDTELRAMMNHMAHHHA